MTGVLDQAADALRDPARRDFMATAGMAGAAVALGINERVEAMGEQTERGSGEIPRRPMR